MPVEFFAKSKKLSDIGEKWKSYKDHLNKNVFMAMWEDKRVEFLANLLYSMSFFLGYNFSQVGLKNDAYYSKGHGEVESEQELIQKGLVDIFKNNKSFPIELHRGSEQAQDQELRTALLAFLETNTKK